MKIAHTALYVSDLEREKDFFLRYFGATAGKRYHNPKTGFSSYFILFEGDTRLEIMSRAETAAEPHSPYTVGYHHISLSLGSPEQVDTLTETLRAADVSIEGEPRTTGDGYYESVILDPEGNRIELTV